jgi:hypothetical protein
MSQKCRECGAQLSSYNSGEICFPCQKKRKEKVQDELSLSAWNRPEYIDFLLSNKKHGHLILSSRNEMLSSGDRIIAGYVPASAEKSPGLKSASDHIALYGKPRVQISLGPAIGKRSTLKIPGGRIQPAHRF